MNLRAAPSPLVWLIRDTFCQAQAYGIFWFMLAVSIVCMLLCLTARVNEPIDPETDPPAEVRLAFGALRVPIKTDRAAAVRNVQLILAGWVADAAGVLITLIWTAGFLPSFEPGAASVLLAKPVSRSLLLGGKFLGVLVFVAFQVAVFIAGTWLALGLCTGVWDLTYFLCIPLLLLHFAVFFSFSTMLAVSTRSTVVCLFGSILFWVLCWGMNYGRHTVLLLPELQTVVQGLSRTVEIAYWVLPKPLDFHLVLQNLLRVEHPVGPVLDLTKLAQAGAWMPGWSLLASTTFAVILLAIAVYDLVTADY